MRLLKTILSFVFVFQVFASDVDHLNNQGMPTILGIQRYEAPSTVVRSLGYDHATQTLEIEFPSGAVYQYYLVPSDVVESLIMAESMGQYFNLVIRPIFIYKWVNKPAQHFRRVYTPFNGPNGELVADP